MKFHGVVGYGETVESPPGSLEWKDVITEIAYSGEIVRNISKSREADVVNDDIAVQNSISIIADAHAFANFMNIRYVMWNGVRWKPSSVDASHRPRLILSLGEVWNGPTPESEGSPEDEG